MTAPKQHPRPVDCRLPTEDSPKPTRDLAARRAALPFCIGYALALPLLLVLLAARLLLSRRPLAGLYEKRTGDGDPASLGCVMIHGVSLGEIMLMRPLIPMLERLYGAPCLITTSTATGWEAARRVFPDHQRRFFPFDAPWAVNRFLRRQRPSRVILLELEVWPVFLLACRERGIPVTLLNGRISGRSFARYRPLRHWLRRVFAVPRLCLAQNRLWAERLRVLGARQVIVTGSLKSDLVSVADEDAIAAERQRLGLTDDRRPIFLIASTSAGEEEMLLRSFQGWGQGWRAIVCPRHPERGGELAATCRRLGLASLRSSTTATPLQPEQDQVIIVDEIGCLGALYGMAELCVVGGSLGSGRQGQNMLEPAAAGRCAVVGWQTANFPEAMALLRRVGGVVEVKPDTLDATLRRLAADQDERQRIGAAARRAWQQDRGALERIEAILAADRLPPEPHADA